MTRNMTRDDDTHLDDLLRQADPWPAERPVDPVIAERARNLVQKEIDMETERFHDPRRRRRRLMIAVAALAALAALAGYGATQLGDGARSTGGGQGRALGGSTISSCIQFTLEQLGQSPVAFDGTVTDIAADGTITFEVDEWFAGGSGDTATARAQELVSGHPSLEGGVGFVAGQRYLVSGDRQDGTIVPAICGYSMEYTEAMATDWARAFGK